MKEDDFKYPYITQQENKNGYEKRLKRYFFSGIPGFSERIDRTGNVQVAENQNYLGKSYFNTPVLDIINNASKKYKEQQNKQTGNLRSFGNKGKTFNFESWNVDTDFLNPKKETEALKSPFGFESNNTKTNHNPFNLSPLYKELARACNNKPQPNRTIGDSLGMESRKIESYADSLKTANINYNTNTVSNNATVSKADKQPGLYGWKPPKDYTEDLNKLKKQLPPIAASILNNSGTEIVVLENLHSVDENGDVTPRIGRYYAGKNKVYLDSEHVNEYTLLSEAIHAVQDYLGMTGSGNSNLEFQEHVIKDLYFKQQYTETDDYNEYKNYPNLSTSTDKEYDNFITNLFDENKVLDLNKFLSNINYFMADFQKNYKPGNSYQKSAVKNFNYNWIKLLHIFGIKYKY